VSGDQIFNTESRAAAGTIALNRGTPCDSENWTNNPSYLGNVQNKDVNCHYSHIGSRICVLSIGTEIGDLQ